jgi:hypothetical protein
MNYQDIAKISKLLQNRLRQSGWLTNKKNRTHMALIDRFAAVSEEKKPRFSNYLKDILPFLSFLPRKDLDHYIDFTQVNGQCASALCLEAATPELLSTIMNIAERKP